MLAIKNLTKKFGDKTILNNVSVNVGKGEIAVFLGQSGVGKSTLLRVLNNLETADSGELIFDGNQLDLSQRTQRHRVGMVFQNFNLFDHLTVEQNITLPLEKVMGKSSLESTTVARKLLAHYGLADKAHVYPPQLSGGQKQRLAIARTIALQPQIICLDEPTSALDPLLTTHVARAIQELADQGYIVLVATHDTALLERLNCTIYLMEGGSIIETARAHDFMGDRARFPRINRFVAGNIE